jgi:hypothetical protein
MRNFVFGILLCFSILGCHRHDRYPDGGHSRRGLFNVDIISNPPGAIIEQEGSYIGKTPLETSIRTVCPPFVNACRSIYITATYHHKVIQKTVKLMGRNGGNVKVYFDFED